MTTFIPPSRRTLPIAVARKAVRALPLLALIAVTAQAAPPAADPPRPTQPTRTIVDRDVQPAGGGCRQCGPTGCKHGHHRNCRDGACVPYCPVRPTTFGFYGTQWRRWPGSGVVPVSNEQAATPVKPPKSTVPGPDEESLEPKAAELPEPDFPADSSAREPRAAMPPEPTAPEPTTPTADEPARPRTPPATRAPATEPSPPAPEPEAESKSVEQPEAAPKPKPQDENLFDESAAARVRRKIPVAGGPRPMPAAPAASRPAAGRVQPAAHEQSVAPSRGTPTARAAGRAVPRVAFDPRQETDSLRRQSR